MTPDRDLDADATEPGVPVQTELPPLPAAGSRRARRRRFGRLTFVLAGLLVAAIGFLVGVQVQKGQSDDSSASGGLPSGFSLPAGSGGGGALPGGGGSGGGGSGATQSGGGGASGVTFGEVKLVDGDNVYVTDAQGNTVKVSAADAQITTSQPGTLNDLKPGETVVVQGEADKEGTVKATSVSTGGAGGGFPGGGGAAAP
jgi:hypothetical protein